MELSDGNAAVTLAVQRRNGTFGEVRVNWELTGNHNESEIRPSNGEVGYLILIPINNFLDSDKIC